MVTRYQNAWLREVQAGAVMMQISRVAGLHGLRLPTRSVDARQGAAESRRGRAHAVAGLRRAGARSATTPASLMQERMRRSISPAEQLSTRARDEAVRRGAARPREPRARRRRLEQRLRLKMEVIDEGALIEGFQKIANRITLGLIARGADRRRRDADAGENDLHDSRVSWPGDDLFPDGRGRRHVARPLDPHGRPATTAHASVRLTHP